jgi:hypothetical protein
MTLTVEPVAHDLAELPPSSRHTPLQPPRVVPPPSTKSGPSGDARLATLLVFAVVLGAGVLSITPHPLGVFSDDGMYAVLARALAEGKGYRFINLPGAPSGTHFPPVYPLLLAALWKLFPAFPQNVLVFKGANVLLNAVAAALAFRFGERTLGLPRWAAGATALLAGVAIPSLLLAGMVMSEPLFLVLLLCALPLAERVRSHSTARGAIAVGAMGGLLMLTRSIGIAFVVGSVVALLVARRWRHAGLVAATAIAFAAPWQLWVARHDDELPPVLRGKYGSYAGWMSRGVSAHGSEFVVRTVAANVATGSRMTLTPLRPPLVPVLVPFVMLAGIVCTVVGCRRLAVRAPVTFLVLGAYVSVVLLWPFDPTRFLWGIWPMLMLLVASTVAELWPLARGAARVASARPAVRLTSRALSAAGVACALLLVAGSTYYTVIGHQRHWYASLALKRETTARPVLEWVLAATQPGDVVASDEETMVFLYTGRLGMPATRFTPDEHIHPPSAAERAADLEQILDRYRPDWVVTTAPVSVAGARHLLERPSARLVAVDLLSGAGLALRPVATHD